MKKFAIILVLAIGAIVAYTHWGSLRPQLAEVRDSLARGTLLDSLAREVSTGGPLRSRTDAPNSRLTVSGVVTWTNVQRSSDGKAHLRENERLHRAAEAKLQDMFRGQYFEHVSPQGKGPADVAEAAGYEYIAIGENLALGNFEDDRALVEAWMNSPGHRANILSGKYTEIGVAVGRGTFEGKQTWLAVQEFGRPASACPQVDGDIKARIQSGQAEVDTLEKDLKAKKAEMDAMGEPDSQSEYDAYNQRVAEYNALVKRYNNQIDVLKQLTSEYNEQVKAFNECVKG